MRRTAGERWARTNECQLLQLPRSTTYYQPAPVAQANLALMRCIDELHLEHPYAGSRMLRDFLRRIGAPMPRERFSPVALLSHPMGARIQLYGCLLLVKIGDSAWRITQYSEFAPAFAQSRLSIPSKPEKSP